MLSSLVSLLKRANIPIGITFTLGICALTALGVALTFHVNTYDTYTIRQGSLDIIANEDAYQIQSNGVSIFMTPPHVAIIGLPFIILGERWVAFWNVFFILLVLTYNEKKLYGFLLKLLFVVSPPILILVAASNINGFTLGIGLLGLLSNNGKWVRGISWAFLLLRPQDSIGILIYDGIQALRQRDYLAFLTCGVIVVLPIIFSVNIFWEWAQAMYFPLFVDSPVGYTLSLQKTHGWMVSGGFLALVIWLRFSRFSRLKGLQLRSIRSLPQIEIYWILFIVVLVIGSYVSYYAIWLVLVILGIYSGLRTLLLWTLFLVIGAFTMIAPTPTTYQLGLLTLIILTAIITPRIETNNSTLGHQ